jgi:hypothetical protein
MHPCISYLFFFKLWNINEIKVPPALVRPWNKPVKEISIVLFLFISKFIFLFKNIFKNKIINIEKPIVNLKLIFELKK